MIYTITLNPSLDYIVHADSFASGKVNRSQREEILPGGKGVNVSRVLAQLGVPSVALGFAAGFTGEEFIRLTGEYGVATDFLPAAGMTRINVKIRSREETDINASGPVRCGGRLACAWAKIGVRARKILYSFSQGAPPHRSLPIVIRGCSRSAGEAIFASCLMRRENFLPAPSRSCRGSSNQTSKNWKNWSEKRWLPVPTRRAPRGSCRGVG